MTALSQKILLGIASAILALGLTTGLISAPSYADQDDRGADVSLTTRTRLSESDIRSLLATVRGAPTEITVWGGGWTGGVVLSDSDPDGHAIDTFLKRSKAFHQNSQIRITGPATLTRSTVARGLNFTTTAAPGHRSEPQGQSGAAEYAPGEDTMDTPPAMPASGQLDQFRMIGDEVTRHRFTGIDASRYPATRIDWPDGNYSLVPSFSYEHDYKIINNGYVPAGVEYTWETNMPGGYKDTRAQDGDGEIDFTIGSGHTWLLRSSTEYLIETVTFGSGSVTSGSAKLTGVAAPNDAQCAYQFTASGSAVGDHSVDPWCFGLSGTKGNISYIMYPTFPIQANGTCYKWRFSQGYASCV